MSSIVKKSPAIQPSAIYMPSRQNMMYNSIHLEGGVYEPHHLPRHATPLMRMLGYSRDPRACVHNRKKFTDYAMKWVCIECGSDV